MEVGIGLPNTIPGTAGATITAWAQAADNGPFASLSVFDRVVYDSLDPLATLAAVATVTERVRLATTVIIGPLRNSALLAKEAATIDVLSGGRLTLGLALGARQDDYRVAGVPYANVARGSRSNCTTCVISGTRPKSARARFRRVVRNYLSVDSATQPTHAPLVTATVTSTAVGRHVHSSVRRNAPEQPGLSAAVQDARPSGAWATLRSAMTKLKQGQPTCSTTTLSPAPLRCVSPMGCCDRRATSSNSYVVTPMPVVTISCSSQPRTTSRNCSAWQISSDERKYTPDRYCGRRSGRPLRRDPAEEELTRTGLSVSTNATRAARPTAGASSSPIARSTRYARLT